MSADARDELIGPSERAKRSIFGSMGVGVLSARHHHVMAAMMILTGHEPEEAQPLYAGDHGGIATGDTKLGAGVGFCG